MYADPRLIRSRTVKFYVNDDEGEAIDKLVKLTGQQRQVLLRDIVMTAIDRVLAAESQPAR